MLSIYLWFDQEEEREDEVEESRTFTRYNIIVYNEEEKACVGSSVDSL